MKDQPLDYEPVRRSHTHDAPPVVAWSPAVATVSELSEDQLRASEQRRAISAGEKFGILRRGHFLSYVGLFLFTAVVYFRPYELIPALKGASSMAFWIGVCTLVIFVPLQLMVEGTLLPRIRELYLILLLGIAAVLSVPFADDPNWAWSGCADFLKVVIMFVVMVNVVRTPKRLGGLLFLLLAVSCYLGLSAVGKYRSGILEYDGYRVAGSIASMFQNPNDLALHIVTVLPIIAALFLTTRKLFLKMFYVASGVLMLVTIVLTYSRGGFLGLIAAVGVLTWKLQKRHRASVVATVLLLGGIFVLLAPNQYGQRVTSLAADDSALARRDDLVRSTLVALRHPLFGIGMNNYVLRSNGNHATHNAYTQVAAEMGIPALVVYVMFLLAPLKRLRKIERETAPFRKTERKYYLAIGLQAALAGFMVSSFFASVAYLWYVYYLVGYAIALDRLYEASHTTITANSAQPKN